ncbi:repressor of RNA polymerase III transcription MAF1, partial [Tremellales sp. Uapishka_1]
MKYLDYPLLTHLNTSLSSNPSPEARVNVRFEAYSIKPVAKERRKFKEMEEMYVSGQEEMEEMSFSPEMREAGLSSCFGRLDVKESRKVHFLLVSTLNSAFPDHEFSFLRPDHFTREPSAAQVLSHLSGNLLDGAKPGMSLGSTGLISPPSSLSGIAMSAFSLPNYSPPNSTAMNPSLVNILNEVIALEECDVYSWFPEPECDPHIDVEEGEEASEDEYEVDYDDDAMEEIEELGMEIDGNEASWGQAGMELDDDFVITGDNKGVRHVRSESNVTKRPMVEEWDRRIGGLLWSANYFFYSKRQKRILFLTSWCRQRSTHSLPSASESTFPLTISSHTPPITTTTIHLTKTRQSRGTRNPSNPRPGQRKKPSTSKLSVGKTVQTSTIPIRGMQTPQARLASSAPTTYHSLSFRDREVTPSPAAALARMTKGGFKPKQTPARNAINKKLVDEPVVESGGGGIEEENQRVRKDRSESTTPGPSRKAGLISLMGAAAEESKGKRVKV